jgi:hypothetical protein
MQRWLFVGSAVGAWGALSWCPAAAIAGNCTASYSINLTVELGEQLTKREDNILIELRQGAVGTSKVVDQKQFSGHTGTVNFLNMCAGSYFIAIGNGSTVAIGPVHIFIDKQHIQSTIRVIQSHGNIGTMNRDRL